MERSNDGASSRPQKVSFEGPGQSGPIEQQRTPQSPKLQKKKSNPGVRPTHQSLPAGPSSAGQGDLTGAGDGTKARKGSIRNAVRRMFGRRSREADSQTQGQQPAQAQGQGQAYPVSPSRHGYHRSEPTGLSPPQEVPEPTTREDDITRRTFSAPFEILPSPGFSRTRSPYAVEFPQSARLKPIDLGNPFSAPGSQLRRRKTLPSMLVVDSDADAIAASIGTSDAPPVPSLELVRDRPSLDVGRTSTARSEKRKSKSADDLRRAMKARENLPRKRSEEIRYWRDSFQGSVLRASGFTVQRPSTNYGQEQEQTEGDKTPIARAEDPFVERRAQGSGSSPTYQIPGPGESEADVGSPSALGTELSRDLEDRIAKLEAGLQNFRGELDQLTADRSRRTIIPGGAPTRSRRRASSDGRTASFLADTLQSDLPPSSYQYQYSDTVRARPSTSPQPPRTPTRDEPRPAIPPIPMREPAMDDPFSSPSDPSFLTAPSKTVVGSDSESGAPQRQPPQHTFRSLYEMLTDERSARRKLEMQLRGLRDEIANLNYQVSLQSNVQSQRSSYYASVDPMVGSSRLHALIRATENSPPRSSQRESAGTRFSTDQPIVSRFSGSESEAGGAAEVEAEEMQTPYEKYQTPAEERPRFTFAGQRERDEGEMF